MSQTMAQVRAVLAATDGQGPDRQGKALFAYWQANLEPRVPKDKTMTNNRWNDAVNDTSLAPATLAFLIDRDVYEVFNALLRENLDPVARVQQ